MDAERARKASSLADIARPRLGTESIAQLRQGFEEILQQKGEIRRVVPNALINTLGALFGKNKMIAYSTDLETDDNKIHVFTSMLKSRKPSKESLIVDIGMRISGGERVRLEINPMGGTNWVYLDRTVFGQRGAPPTAGDIALYSEVLENLQDAPSLQE